MNTFKHVLVLQLLLWNLAMAGSDAQQKLSYLNYRPSDCKSEKSTVVEITKDKYDVTLQVSCTDRGLGEETFVMVGCVADKKVLNKFKKPSGSTILECWKDDRTKALGTFEEINKKSKSKEKTKKGEGQTDI